MTTRRAFLLTAATWPVLTWTATLHAQAPKVRRIGWLSPGSLTTHGAQLDAFRQGMRELGYVEGRNFTIEIRWAEGRLERLPQLAADLVGMNPEVIVSAAVVAHLAAQNATSTIPIVMGAGGDPVAAGLVANLARPGGNITGVINYVGEPAPKLIELIHDALPKAVPIAVLMNPKSAVGETRRVAIQQAARALGVNVLIVEVADTRDINTAFDSMVKQGARALVVISGALFNFHRERIVQAAARTHIPAIYAFREFAEAGGLMSYSLSFRENFVRAARFVDKIFKGARPGDLPIEQPTKFELVINMKTAKALGVTIRPSVLVRADRVIE